MMTAMISFGKLEQESNEILGLISQPKPDKITYKISDDLSTNIISKRIMIHLDLLNEL